MWDLSSSPSHSAEENQAGATASWWSPMGQWGQGDMGATISYVSLPTYTSSSQLRGFSMR